MTSGDPAGFPYKRPESVLVVVHNSSGEVLLLKRADHEYFWQSVTGSLRWPCEIPECAAQRELAEETGLEAGAGLRDWNKSFAFPILPQWRQRYAPGTTVNREHVFTLQLDARPPVRLNRNEHTEFVWVDCNTAAAKVWSWTNRAIILALRDQSSRPR